MARRSYQATYTRTQSSRRRPAARRTTGQPVPRTKFGPVFFIVMGVTIASAVGFLGVVASVLAGN